MTAASVSNHKRSWFAYLSAGLGLLALLGVLCFHFPQLLTSREFRATYEEGFARQLLLLGIVAVFILGAVAILRGRDRRVALVGVGAAALAMLLDGATVHFSRIQSTPCSLGLDGFVISLFFSTIVFVPIAGTWTGWPGGAGRIAGGTGSRQPRPEFRLAGICAGDAA